MASIDFYSRFTDPISDAIDNLSGSGLGFYGPGFGLSVAVGQYQDTTFVTNSDGTVESVQADNIKYTVDDSGNINSATSGVNVINIPNDYASLNVRFTNVDAVRVQNAKLRIFDRTNIANAASGVTTQVYEVRHPEQTQTGAGLAGQSIAWTAFTYADAAKELTINNSPGASGTNASSAGNGALSTDGSAHQSTRHDWYLALSASPDSIGSKTQFGLYVTLEYL